MSKDILDRRFKVQVRMHMLFSFGAAIVILGVLFKVLHLEIGFLTGNLVLGVGLACEALIFTLSGLQTSDIKDKHEKRIREIEAIEKEKLEGRDGLASKIDTILNEAKVDTELIGKLRTAIEQLEDTAGSLASVTNVLFTTNSLGEHLEIAVKKMQLLASSTQHQIDTFEKQKELNELLTVNMGLIRKQTQDLNENLASLNKIYSGMLEVMAKNNGR